jgi:hypothetical protein
MAKFETMIQLAIALTNLEKLSDSDVLGAVMRIVNQKKDNPVHLTKSDFDDFGRLFYRVQDTKAFGDLIKTLDRSPQESSKSSFYLQP